MAIGFGQACPKPRPRVLDRQQQKREDEQKQRGFIAAVWKNAGGKCEWCGVKVIKTLSLDPKQGQVDHIKPRSRAPELKFDPKNGRLLCRVCHDTRHGR